MKMMVMVIRVGRGGELLMCWWSTSDTPTETTVEARPGLGLVTVERR